MRDIVVRDRRKIRPAGISPGGNRHGIDSTLAELAEFTERRDR